MVVHAIAVCVNTEKLETAFIRDFFLQIVPGKFGIRAHERSGHALFGNLTSLLCSV